MTKEIPLTKGFVALVDDKDYEELSKYKWHATKMAKNWYAGRSSPRINGKYHLIYMHGMILGTPKGMDSDHINGNGLDNRRENLRIVTHRENMLNQHITTTSKYSGVSWHSNSGKWRAQIRIDGKNIHLGRFDNEETAARAYHFASKTTEWIYV